jgi:hypothetical protein
MRSIDIYLGIIHAISLCESQTGHVLKSFFGCEGKRIRLEPNSVRFERETDHESREDIDKVLEQVSKAN